MVVFTCYHCGDSIQKPKVEKHINLECKKKNLGARLCCIDCLKDFDRKTYVEHTKCVSEEERYSGKGFVPKPSSNKGEKKQNTWIEIIQAVLKKPDLKDQQRALLKALSYYANVPRKQQKFKNFINSSLKHVRAQVQTVEEVYNLIESEFKSAQAANLENNSVPKKDSASAQQSNPNDTKESEDIQSDDKATKKTKKNECKLKDIENTDIPEESASAAEKANLDENAAYDVIKKKKKKEKKSKKENVENENVTEEIVKSDDTRSINENSKSSLENNVEEISMKGLSKKKAKKLKLQEVLENPLSEDSQINITQNGSMEVELNDVSATLTSPEKNKTVDNVESVEENLSKKERKEKKKRLKYEAELKAIETEAVKPDEQTADLQDETDGNKKHKKKKRKLVENTENEEVAHKKTKLVEPVASKEEIVETTVGKFSWEEVIRMVLEKAEGHEISLKKLTKKVVAEYQACYGEEKSYEDALKRFNKKINKLPFVKILKDKVKLCD